MAIDPNRTPAAAGAISVEAMNVGLLNRRDLTDRGINGFAAELLVESVTKSRVLEAIPEGVSFEFDHVHPPNQGIRISVTRGEPEHRATCDPSDYEWAMGLLEDIVSRQADEDRLEIDPPWRFDLYIGDDDDVIPVEGRTLLHVLLAYFERVEPDPAEEGEAQDIDDTRTRLRNLIADRHAKTVAAGEAFYEKLKAADAARSGSPST